MIWQWLRSFVNRIQRMEFKSNVVSRKYRHDFDRPLIVVMGPTGTGKSKLSIEICRHYGGEVINADAMQIYQGLNIVTNKVTPNEMRGVSHHMLGFLSPSTTGYNVTQFRDTVLPLLDQIWTRGNLPVLVGGTNYYIEAILWTMLIDAKGGRNCKVILAPMPDRFLRMSTDELYGELLKSDAESAKQIHKNCRYRVQRALQILLETGRPRSAILSERRHQYSNDLGDDLRFPNSLILWLDADLSVLRERLNVRVSDMVIAGLREEIEQFHTDHPPDCFDDIDKAKGIFQTIGLSDFNDYLQLSSVERHSPKGDKLFKLGCESMRIRTRQYANKQRKRVSSRLLRRVHRRMPPVYRLDTSDIDRFYQVIESSFDIIDNFLNKIPIDFPLAIVDSAHPTAIIGDDYALKANQIYHCQVCDMAIHGTQQWQCHLRGRKHRVLTKKTSEPRSKTMNEAENIAV